MGTYDIKSDHIHITKQSSTDEYYVSWSLTGPQKKKKISKSVYRYSQKKKKNTKIKTTHKFTTVIDGYTVLWYYRIGSSKTWYLDKTSSCSSSTYDTKADLYSPHSDATALLVKVKPVSETYVSDKNSHTGRWFTAHYSQKIIGYNGYPSTPSISTFTIKNKALESKISFNLDDQVDVVHLQILKDESKVIKTLTINTTSTQKSQGFVIFNDTLSEVGSYQIRAYVTSNYISNKKNTSKSSDWTDWSSIIETRPKPPVLEKCEAIDADKIKVTWSAVAEITKYSIEYVIDSEENFNNGMISSVSVENLTTYVLSGLSSGAKYYIRVKSINDSDSSDPSNVLSSILATKPEAPTTWSSATVMQRTDDIETTDKEYLYWLHNSKDGSAQRSSELRIEIAGTEYYLFVENTNMDEYGNLIDKTMQIDFWPQMLYSSEGSNTTEAGTIFDLFTAGGGDSIKWKVRTKGVHADYSDWSVQRIIKAYLKPTLTLSVLDKNNVPLVDDILTGYPFILKGSTMPNTQTPISFYISITTAENYEGEDEYGEEINILAGTEIFTTYVDLDTLNLTLSASDIDLESGIEYTISVIVYLNSGLNASSSYSFTTSWEESADTPDAEIDYNETYRYTKIRPYCEYYLGDNTLETEPNIYYGSTISGTSVDNTVFAGSGITAAVAGDLYFNYTTYTVYLCTLSGDAATATWVYKTTFDYDASLTWYSGTAITVDYVDEPISSSEVASAVVNDYYFNTTTGDIFKCTTAGTPDVAIWDYVWNIFWQTSANMILSVYRKNSDGSYTTIAEGIDNIIQSSDSAIYVKDRHPSFGTCTYRIVAINSENSGISYTDIVQSYKETSVILQWDEDWEDTANDPTIEEYQGSILELPANITLSDSASHDVTLAEYIGRTRPVSYYGTQKGESLKISCVFPKEDTTTLETLRHLMAYSGDVYVREPSGLGYWANVGVSYDCNYNDVTIPVSLDIKPVEGGA